MRAILVLNAKGGSGKTTMATNLAGYYAQQGAKVVLADFDPQGSSVDWLRQRPAAQRAQQLAAVRKEWGGEFDENVRLGKRAVREFGLEGSVEKLEAAQLCLWNIQQNGEKNSKQNCKL